MKVNPKASHSASEMSSGSVDEKASSDEILKEQNETVPVKPELKMKDKVIPKLGEKDELCCCENCGISGMTRGFVSGGKFCSEFCQEDYMKKENCKNCGKFTYLKENLSSQFCSFSCLKSFYSKPNGLKIEPKVSVAESQKPTKKVITTSPIITNNAKPTLIYIPTTTLTQPIIPIKSTAAETTVTPTIFAKPIASTGTKLSSGMGLINLTISNGEIKSGVGATGVSDASKGIKNTSPGPFLVSMPNNQPFVLQSSGLTKEGKPLMVFKPVSTVGNFLLKTGKIVSNDLMQNNISNAGIQTTTTKPVTLLDDTSTSSAPKTILVPVMSSPQVFTPTSNSTPQTVSTPSGQKIQITLTPQNTANVVKPNSLPVVIQKTSKSPIAFHTIPQVTKETYGEIKKESDCGQDSNNAVDPVIINVSHSSMLRKTASNVSTANSIVTPLVQSTIFDSGNKKSSADLMSKDFDPVTAMEWKNGVASLPGSTLKFKLNEFGTLEVVTERLTDHNCKEEKKEHKSSNPDCCRNCRIVYYSPKCQSATETFCSLACRKSFSENDRENLLRQEKIILGKRKLLSKPLDIDKNECSATEIVKKMRRIEYFNWVEYLQVEKATAAPLLLFKDPFFVNKNQFKVGMKLEGIDPNHPSLFCVMTVNDVLGCRMRLHFDGYSEDFDFWTNCYSNEIFPIGWCDKTGHKLCPPRQHAKYEEFSWQGYLKQECSVAAPRYLFLHVSRNNTQVTPTGFRIGAQLEAVDKQNDNLLCVATISDTIDNRFLVHFDGWDDTYDYWADPSSPYIHPVGWCQENGETLTPPNNYEYGDEFDWQQYMKDMKTTAVPARAFKRRHATSFRKGMKVEAVDIRNPMLVRVAEIFAIEQYSLLIHFDGWDHLYDFWVNDDWPDLHPIKWCYKTGYPLQPPPKGDEQSSGCKIPGCHGFGRIKERKYKTHDNKFMCPYYPPNLTRDSGIQDRLGGFREDIIITQVPHKKTSSLISSSAAEKNKNGGNVRFSCQSSPNGKSPPVLGKLDNRQPPSGFSRKTEKLGEIPKATKVITKKKRGRKPKNQAYEEAVELLKTTGLSYPSTLASKKSTYPNNLDSVSPKKDVFEADEKYLALMNTIHGSIFYEKAFVDNSVERFRMTKKERAMLIPGLENKQTDDISRWSVGEVADFVQGVIGCNETITQQFSNEEIDGEALLMMNQSDLVKILGIRLGPALKIYNSISLFQQNASHTSS